MATLELVTLECHRQHDVTGLDEPKIIVDGIIVWNGAIDKGAKADLRPTSVHFNGRAEVTLEEVTNGKVQADRRPGDHQGKRQPIVGGLQDLRHVVRAVLRGVVTP